ncbi:MAG TPA: hypothetical protein VGQ17_14245 [Gemmatimonadales bacterium]|jgi:hypothetical protein|nr:hypothetical protein [Gemmatimonadales bacterium]
MRTILALSLIPAPCALLTSCSVTPLTNKIEVGQEAFVVAVGEGSDGMTDLYAAPAGGGGFVRLSYTRMVESLPRLSASGRGVAFLRRAAGQERPTEIVVMNLESGGERRVRLPVEAGGAMAVAWLPGDAALAVRAGSGLYRFAAPPAAPALTRLRGADSARADSALGVALGTPVAAMAVSCAAPEVAGRTVAPAAGGICVRTAGEEIAPLDSLGRDPVRWGADSVGYFTPAGFEVRPLAGGRSRRPEWSGAPARLRELSYAAAPAAAPRGGAPPPR